MVATGEIIEVEVRTAAPFGLLCGSGEQDIRVLIPETSWVASFCSCQQFAAPGDRFRVKVLHADADSGKVSASIKALYPDPWRSGWLAPGTEHRAYVVRFVESADRCGGGPGYLLELMPGTYVVLCGGGVDLEVGRAYTVTVVESDYSKRAVQVALVQGKQAEPGPAADCGGMTAFPGS
jgi:hypothetical protein